MELLTKPDWFKRLRNAIYSEIATNDTIVELIKLKTDDFLEAYRQIKRRDFIEPGTEQFTFKVANPEGSGSLHIPIIRQIYDPENKVSLYLIMADHPVFNRFDQIVTSTDLSDQIRNLETAGYENIKIISQNY